MNAAANYRSTVLVADIFAILSGYIARPVIIRVLSIFNKYHARYNIYNRRFRSPRLLLTDNPFDVNWKYYRDSYLLLVRSRTIYKYYSDILIACSKYYICKSIKICDRTKICISYKICDNYIKLLPFITYYGYKMQSNMMIYDNGLKEITDNNIFKFPLI